MSVPVYFRSLIFTIFVPGTVAGLVPFWLAKSKIDAAMWGKSPVSQLSDILGYALVAIGGLIYLWCVYDFTFAGRGTPAIFDPPKKLVVRGLYKYVRNPMYVGVIALILGQVFLYGSPFVLLYAIGFAIVFMLFVKFYEEPHLSKKFGQNYLNYKARVNRWIPSLVKKV